MKQITEVEKNRASEWFVSLRNDIVSAFEELEKSHFKGPFRSSMLVNLKSTKQNARISQVLMLALD